MVSKRVHQLQIKDMYINNSINICGAFGLQNKIIPRYNLGLSCEIILAMTNYPMIIYLGLSCGVESHEPNTLQI